QGQELLNLVSERIDVAPWCDETIATAIDQVPRPICDVVDDGNASGPHRFHHRQWKTLARACQPREGRALQAIGNVVHITRQVDSVAEVEFLDDLFEILPFRALAEHSQ